MAASNFNYQVALKEGLKSLQQGRLRQAEQSFRYLVDKFPGAEGGYRGLAKVHFEQEDRAGALKVLRDGAAALTRSGERSAAIGLLREAVTLDARDLATHRRLAAALALAGDMEAAVQEYARYIRDLRAAGDHDRAKLEVAYALGQLKDAPSVGSLRDIADGETPGSIAPASASANPPAPMTRIDAPQPSVPKSTRDETIRAAFGGPGTTSSPKPSDPWSQVTPPPSDDQVWSRPSAASQPSIGIPPSADDPWSSGAPSPARADAWQTGPAATGPARGADGDDPWASGAPARAAPATEPTPPSASVDAPPAPPMAPESAPEAPLVEPAPAAALAAAEPPAAPDEQVEAAAARYLATRDPRAAGPALEAARRYIKDGRTDAASDLLLQLIASGVADHDAQRLLVDVARTLGKREVAKAKCQLLVQALLLDGRNDLAAEVEALAQSE